MKKLAINRLGIIGIPKGKGLEGKHKLVILSELARMGYRLTNPELLDSANPSFLLEYRHLMEELKRKRGGKVKYVPLFKSFPQGIPDDYVYLYKRILGYTSYYFWDLYETYEKVELQNGMQVPVWLFETTDYGADPLSQFQSKELYELAVKEDARKQADNHVEWIDLTLAYNEDMLESLQDYLRKLVYSNSSIKEEYQDEIFQLFDHFGHEALDGRKIVFKEIKALLLKRLWKNKDYDGIKHLANSATDVLRMFASVTNTDVSLTDPIRFPKMNRKMRKTILSVLEGSHSLADEIRAYKGIWLQIGRYLHPGEYAKAFPKTAEVFDSLRNGKIENFASKTERLIMTMEVEGLMEHLEKRPGVYARKLHEILRYFEWAEEFILESFAKGIDKVQIKNLMVMRKYFATINQAKYRTVINKKGKIRILYNNTRNALAPATIARVNMMLEDAIMTKIARKESWEGKTYWIDPSLRNYLVPLQQRAASDGMITVGRGSRIDIDFGKVLRLFIYWKENGIRTDLDLSVMQFDQNFNYVGHVSYTNLKSLGIVHSGDIQSAPHGAAEFIDITLKALPANVRYLAVQIYRYAGHKFQDMDCHAGWMIREKTGRRMKTFDIKTVANKFDLNGTGAYAIPLMVDLKARQIIFTDLFMNGKDFHNNVEGSYGNVALICSQIRQYVKTRPTMEDLAWYNAMARKATFTDQKEHADITFGYKDCTYNATDVATILSELI